MTIHQLIPKIAGEIGAVTKTRQGPGVQYKFRGIDDIYIAICDLLAENGVFTVPSVLKYSREERTSAKGAHLIYTVLEVKYTFYASDGTSVEAVTIGEAMDSGDKSANKAMSAAHKYALIQVFTIKTNEPIDTENETHEVRPPQKDKPERPPHHTDDFSDFSTPQQLPHKSLPHGIKLYTVPFGKYEGRAIESIIPDELRGYCEYIVDKADKDGKEIQGKVKEFLERAEAYLFSQNKKG